MKKKKTGSVAIPFLITLLISLVLIGGAAIIIYDKIDNDDSSLISMVNEVGTLSEGDNHTIMFVLDMSDSIDSEYENNDEDDYYEDDYDSEEGDEETEDNSSKEYIYEPYTFMIMRSEPVDKKLTFLGIPSNMLIGENNKTAQDIYIDNGSAALVSSVEYTLGINIDRYMTFDTESFKKVCNILGGVTFAVPKGVKDVSTSESEQYLSAEQIESIISCGNYSGGELQRISTASSLITAMINQTNGERIAGNLDNSFNAIINMTKSNISAIDYNEKKYAIKFMLKYSDPADSESRSTRAQFITPYGSTEGGKFVADKYFADDIKVYFEQADNQNAAIENTEAEKIEENE